MNSENCSNSSSRRNSRKNSGVSVSSDHISLPFSATEKLAEEFPSTSNNADKDVEYPASVEITDSDELVLATRKIRSGSVDSVGSSEEYATTSLQSTLSPQVPIFDPETNDHSIGKLEHTDALSGDKKAASTRVARAPSPPSKPPSKRSRAEIQRARRLAMPAKYENEGLEGSKLTHKLTSADIKQAVKIAEVIALSYMSDLLIKNICIEPFGPDPKTVQRPG